MHPASELGAEVTIAFSSSPLHQGGQVGPSSCSVKPRALTLTVLLQLQQPVEDGEKGNGAQIKAATAYPYGYLYSNQDR